MIKRPDSVPPNTGRDHASLREDRAAFGQDLTMDEAVSRYIEGIAPASRELFDRVHRLIMTAHPEASVSISYRMPTYKVGSRRLHVGAWKHGISLYGWQADHDGGFSARHPDLITGRGTLQLRHDTAGDIPDAELLDLARHALSP